MSEEGLKIPDHDTPSDPVIHAEFERHKNGAIAKGAREFRVLNMGHRADEAHTSFEVIKGIDEEIVFQWKEKDVGDGMEGGKTMDTRKALVAKFG